MARPEESQILEEFRRRVAEEDLGQVGIAFRVPTEDPDEAHATEELRLEGETRARAQLERADAPPTEADATLEATDTSGVLHELAEVVGELVPRSEARFVPDSAVGSVRLEVDDRAVDLFFLVDEGEREAQQRPLSDEALEALEHLTQLQHRLLEE